MDITMAGVDLAKNVFVACVADRGAARVQSGGLSHLARRAAGGHGDRHGNLRRHSSLGPHGAASGARATVDGGQVRAPLPQAPVGQA